MSDREFNDPITWERLADGELPPAEYRRVLASMDEDPERWKQCALAFLENQALGQELSGAMDEPLVATKQPERKQKPRRARAGHLWAWGFAAATILIAGLVWWNGSRPDGEGSLGSGLAQDSEDPLGDLTLVVDDESTKSQKEFTVPVFDGSQFDEKVLQQLPPVIPTQVVKALREKGNEVRRVQKWLPIELEDGRQILVPVEQLEVVPEASDQIY